jgi:predicted RND superfamily exporter protein
MFQTTLIAGFGLAAFALSTFTPTQMFGTMMLAILLTAMLGDLIFLAAMLNTPLGRFFEPKRRS